MKRALAILVGACSIALPSLAAEPRAASPGIALAEKALGDEERDLVFVPITPCTVWDTRYATDGSSAGFIFSGQTRRFFSHRDDAGGNFTTWGGNPSCPEATYGYLQNIRPFAVVMTVTVASASAAGWLTFYRDGDPDPSFATISVYYQPGQDRTQTVISKSARPYNVSALYDIAVTSRYGGVHAAASITGYFVKATGVGGGGGGVTDVTASTPLASSGGATPNISLAGTVPVANGGTGRTTLTANSVLFGAGAGQVGLTNVGQAGQVLQPIGGFAPTWTSNMALAGNMDLANSTTTVGVITKNGGTRFIHNTGTRNTFVGFEAGSLNVSTGSDNTGVGYEALETISTGVGNTAVGRRALQSGGASNANTAVGHSALLQNSGASNTAIGSAAMVLNSGGANNTAIGAEALAANTTGTNNISIGYQSGTAITNSSGNILIGNPGIAADANTTRIGVSQTRTFIAGIRGITVGGTTPTEVLIDGNGQLGTISSSARTKDDVEDMGNATADLMKLRPVRFHYKEHGAEAPLQYGLIAEEVEKVYPELVAKLPDGSAETVMYRFLPPMLLNEHQKLRREVEELRAVVSRLEALLQKEKR